MKKLRPRQVLRVQGEARAQEEFLKVSCHEPCRLPWCRPMGWWKTLSWFAMAGTFLKATMKDLPLAGQVGAGMVISDPAGQ